MQIEGRTTSPLDYFAKMQFIFYKDMILFLGKRTSCREKIYVRIRGSSWRTAL